MSCDNDTRYYGSEDVTFVIGDDIIMEYQITTEPTTSVYPNGTPVDVTGWTFKYAIKKNATDTAYIITPITQSAVTITAAAAGKIKVSVSNSVTAGLAVGFYVHELQSIDATAKIATLIQGTVQLINQIIT